MLIVILLVAQPATEYGEQQNYPIRYTNEVERWAVGYDVDPLLIYAFIRTESSFHPDAESDAGARGLMQMTSNTFDWVKSKIAPDEELTFDDLFVPDTSIRFGTYLVSQCLERYSGDISTAAAAYHSGWGTVDGLLEQSEYSKDGITLSEFPYRQMQHYVNKINANYEKYREIHG